MGKMTTNQFSDEFIKSEIARLEKEIADCDTEISKNEQNARYCESQAQKLLQRRIEDENIYKGATTIDMGNVMRNVRSMWGH